MNDLQKKILDIFKAVAKICKDHDITYYAIGGTAIGAVRHQGFIPWDDDLDIAIPIEQYDRFIEIARRELPEGLTVMTPVDIEHYASFFIKVVDTRTTLIENYAKAFPDAYYGVFVDIMPLAGVPAPGKERKRYLRMWKQTAMLNYARRFPVNRMKTRARVAACRLLRPFHGRIPYHYFTDKMFEEYRKRVYYAAERINEIPNMHVLYPPKGTFYLFVNIKDTGLDSVDVSDIILREAHVLTIPGIAFGNCGEGYIRLACTVNVDTLKEAFDRIGKVSIFQK